MAEAVFLVTLRGENWNTLQASLEQIARQLDNLNEELFVESQQGISVLRQRG